MAAGKKSLYEILGIDRDANAIDIGLAYERRRDALARAVPPDASESALVQQAYEVLSDAKRRAAYDASLITAEEKAAAAAQATDLVLEPEEPEAPRRNPMWVGLGAGLVVIIAALYFTFRGERAPAVPKEPPAEAPKPVVQAPPPAPKPLPPATILAAATSSVGQLLSYDMGGQAKPIGLAVAIDRGVFLATCHGISAGSALVVRIGLESHSASLAMADEELDLCRVAVPDLKGGGLVTGDEPKAGDKVYAMGANARGEMALTEGTVKQLRASSAGPVIEVSIPIAPGSSGGPVFDTYGRLVGIATTPHGYGAGLSIALPVAWATQMRSRVKPAR